MPELQANLIKRCADHLALTVDELMWIATKAPRLYYVWKVDKKRGPEKRTLCHPARELKPVQYYLLHHVLDGLPVHPAATAYVPGSSIKKNAEAHVHSRVMLKLDFEDFFNSLKVANWRKFAADTFPEWSREELDFTSQILFWGAGSSLPRCLAIGAPTSPLLSNALMYEVDVALQAFAERSDLTYTRYADDITFSSRGELDRDKTIMAVRRALSRAEYTSVRLKAEKTILVSNRFSRRVTGLIITPDHKVSLGRERKRTISAMVHHARRLQLAAEAWPRLAGLLAFANDIEPNFVTALKRKYGAEIIDLIMHKGTGQVPQ